MENYVLTKTVAAVIFFIAVVVLVWRVITMFRERSAEDRNTKYTRIRWEKNIGILRVAQMDIRKIQYSSGGVCDQFGKDSPQMKMYDDLFQRYDAEIAEFERRLSFTDLQD